MFRNFANNENGYRRNFKFITRIWIFKIENLRVRFLVDLKKWETANKLHVFERLLTCWKFNKVNSLFITKKDIFLIVYLHTIIYHKCIDII